MQQNYQFPTQDELDALKLNWRRYLLPAIHREGLKILLAELFIFTALWGLFYLCSLFSFWWIGLPLLIFSFYFFRNPTRVSPKGDNLVLAPADGIVSNIKLMVPPKELDMGDKPLIRISTFMSVFSVHVNRSPITGTVDKLHYHPGKFVSVADKDSEENERQEISLIATNGQKVGCIQIAGLVARRIYCPLKENDKLTAGQIFGMIRFGSRLDIYLPDGVYPKVSLGQTMIAGETIMAELPDKK